MLEKYARKNELPPKLDGFIGGKIPKQLELQFKEHCHKNNLPVQVALRLLIEAELNPAPAWPPANPEHIPGGRYVDNKLISINALPGEHIQDHVSIPLQTSPNAKKGIYSHLKIDGQLPCTICNAWHKSSNFARHVKKHGYASSQAFFEENIEAAEIMAANKKAQA